MSLSLYIHVPFCRRKCSYCDFYSLACRETDIPAYTQALFRELAVQAEAYGHPQVHTVFFGGGTPTLLSGTEIGRIMSVIREQYELLPECEITMEGNPGTLTKENLAGYAAAGVNRLSIGVQSFSDSLLRSIGRIHTRQQAVAAVRLARQAGFCSLNLDLMYGLPGQTPALWQETVEEAVRLAPEHLSCYSLIVEPGTPLAVRLERGEGESLPDEDATAEMESFLRKCLSDAGYGRYEVSNWAKPGFECRHNIVYWECGPYLGFGPGAHSDCGGQRFCSPDNLMTWMDGVMNACPGSEPAEPSGRSGTAYTGTHYIMEGTGSLAERRYERMMMGLRMTRGADAVRFERDFGTAPEAVWPKTMEEMRRLHMLVREAERIRLTESGMDVMNYWLVRMLEEEEAQAEENKKQ